MKQSWEKNVSILQTVNNCCPKDIHFLFTVCYCLNFFTIYFIHTALFKLFILNIYYIYRTIVIKSKKSNKNKYILYFKKTL